MKIGSVVGITVFVCLMALFQWPKMDQHPKKDKIAFVTLTAIGWILALLLIYFPDMPGPNKMVGAIFKPLEWLIPK
ncbi:hypothetical protein LSG31_15380 [Fodinisporobacter ferrooxydans]|uniref:Uncharacterized protein n=1 Tax=Fodinisporobacter ferrooxydans TaxID=2901836 RepID=A0ABY4CFG4_9BACL|nr:hypothetical protein LSG31_15380 [Alicyclobacillaceae bacterium MYW30-H2]